MTALSRQLLKCIDKCLGGIGMAIGTFNDSAKPFDNAGHRRRQLGHLKLLQSQHQFLQISAILFHVAVFKA